MAELGKILSINTNEFAIDWKYFIEAKARRDLGVHNGWKINDTYIRKVKEIGIDQIPSTITPDFKYVEELVKCCLRLTDKIKEQIINKYS